MGRLTTLLQSTYRTETILEDWRNSLLVVLYKGKGPKNDCSYYRGISLLSVVGKIFICCCSSIVFEYDHGNKEKNIIIYLFIYTYILY